MALLHYSPPVDPYLTFLYRDNDILVLDKPAELLSVPGKALEHRDSLQTRVQRVFPTATIVHRLDMATSGILIIALNKQGDIGAYSIHEWFSYNLFKDGENKNIKSNYFNKI